MESSTDRKEEGIAFANGREAEDIHVIDNVTENDSEETESNTLEWTTTCHSENPCEHCENANVYENIGHVMY